jgi:hypothetical protein
MSDRLLSDVIECLDEALLSEAADAQVEGRCEGAFKILVQQVVKGMCRAVPV